MTCRTIRLFALVSSLLLVTACATAPGVTVNYSPTSTMSLHGAVTVGKFGYAPAESGKVKDNQIQNTAIGSIYLAQPVADLFQRALTLESRFVGISIADGPTVHGKINSFLADDLGYSVDWTLDVTYIVDSPSGATQCYQSDKVYKERTAKFFNFNGTLDTIIRKNIEELFQDPAFVACIK